MMKNILYVMLGGSVGAALRYMVQLVCAHWRMTALPIGTFIVNILGCLLMGILCGLGQKWAGTHSELLLLLAVGVCGAFTTFSTFSADAVRLMDNGQWWIALGYVVVSIVVGFALFYLGRKIIMW